MWLSGLKAGLLTKGSPVHFPVRAHAWVAGQVPSRGHTRANHTLMFLFLPFSLLSPLYKNKINKIFKKINVSVCLGLYKVHRGRDLYLLFIHIFQLPIVWSALNNKYSNEQILECKLKNVGISLKDLIFYKRSSNNYLQFTRKVGEEKFNTY